MYGDNLGIRGLTHVSLLLVRLVGVVLEPVSYTPFQPWDPSSPKIQGSITAATHTLKFTDQTPRCISTTRLPSIGASSPHHHHCSQLYHRGPSCILAGTMSVLISIAVESVSTTAMHGESARVMGTWQKSPRWVQPTALTD